MPPATKTLVFDRAVPLPDTGAATAVSRRATWAALVELTKPRLSLMTVLSAVFGFLAAPPTGAHAGVLAFLGLVVGTSLSAGAAAALNQWMERGPDLRMQRTRSRPLPAGALRPGAAFGFGMALAVSGMGVLWATCSFDCAALVAAILILYLGLYTPAKRLTTWSTEFGALPGALPPVVGYVAATGELGGFVGWFLFGVVACWQIPHFMAISWMYREDYARGGFRMLAVVDDRGRRVARRAVLGALGLVIVALLPLWLVPTTLLYAVTGPLLAVALLALAVRFWWRPQLRAHARWLFLASLLFLPAFMLLFTLDRYLAL